MNDVEERVAAAYVLGYNESKHHVLIEFYDKIVKNLTKAYDLYHALAIRDLEHGDKEMFDHWISQKNRYQEGVRYN